MKTSKSHALPTAIDAVERASRQQLGAWYEVLYGRVPPAHASQTFLRGNLLWAVQVRQSGQDPLKLQRQLVRQLAGVVKGTTRQQSTSRPGTRLVREWQGTVHNVTVTDKGYTWEGRVYRSLTRIATEITGTKWSGPRFFGLRRAA